MDCCLGENAKIRNSTLEVSSNTSYQVSSLYEDRDVACQVIPHFAGDSQVPDLEITTPFDISAETILGVPTGDTFTAEAFPGCPDFRCNCIIRLQCDFGIVRGLSHSPYADSTS